MEVAHTRNASPMSIDSVEPKAGEGSTIGLPTPSSLPRLHSGAGAGAVSDTVEHDDDRMDRSGSESADDSLDNDDRQFQFVLELGLDDRERGLDVEMAPPPLDAGAAVAPPRPNLAQVVSTPARSRLPPSPTSSAAAIAPAARPPFSSQNLFRRPFRARYALDDGSDADEDRPDEPATPSYKRTFEQVAPSTGTTPPFEASPSLPALALFSPLTSFTTTAPRPSSSSSHLRHSFDSQRAVASSSLRSRFGRDHDQVNATLRRRSPASSRTASRDRELDSAPTPLDRDRSKRRRPDLAEQVSDRFEALPAQPPSLGNQHALLPTQVSSRVLDVAPPTPAASAPRVGTRSEDVTPVRRSRLSLPSLLLPNSRSTPSSSPRPGSREQTPPALSPSSSDDGTRPRRSSASFPSLSTFRRTNVAPLLPSGSSSAVETAILRPRSARARPDVERERQFDPLVAFWREERENERNAQLVERSGRALLDEASGRLAAAERTMRDAARVLPEPERQVQPPMSDDVFDVFDTVSGRLEAAELSIERTTRMLERFPAVPHDGDERLPHLPSTQHLVHPDRSNETRSTVGVRIGEGWSSPRQADAVDASTPSSPSSDDYPLGTSASRALHFLSHLRSRRPRLSRNSTGVPAPEDSPSPNSAERQHWLAPAPEWNEAAEAQEAESLNERLLAVRAAGAWATETESALWGEPRTTTAPGSLLSRRMRGPTERANRLWRQGREPEAAATGTTPAGGTPPRLLPRSETFRRDAALTWHPAPAPPREAHTFDGDGWRRLDATVADPPHARSSRMHPPGFGALDLDADFGPDNTFPLHRRTQAPPVRITPFAGIFRDDDQDERPRIWDHPNLPPMLPSGSAGRRVAFESPTFGSYPQGDHQHFGARGATGRASRFHPAFGFESNPNPINRRSTISSADPPRTLGARAPAPDPSGLRTHRRTTLADALSHFSTRDVDTTLRRRHTADVEAPQTERLASIRRERQLVQSLLTNPDEPRSPGSRLRNLGEFLRGFGPGTGRFASLFDDDFSAFFGRDSAALDPRNYLDDDDFDTSYESLIRLQERLGDVKPVQGVSADKLATLTTFKYAAWPFPPRKGSPEPLGVATTSAVTIDADPVLARRGLEKEERCSVCLADYEDEDDITLGDCRHGFHSDCLTAWLKASPACPVCRHSHA